MSMHSLVATVPWSHAVGLCCCWLHASPMWAPVGASPWQPVGAWNKYMKVAGTWFGIPEHALVCDDYIARHSTGVFQSSKDSITDQCYTCLTVAGLARVVLLIR